MLKNFNLRKILPYFATIFITLALGIAGFIWWNHNFNTNLNNGLASLKKAYQAERFLKYRIADLDYAPFSETRGNAQKVNSVEISRSEKYLIDAVHFQPNSDSYYALGKFYLAQNDIDSAIENFEIAGKDNKNNPKLNNDFGVAYLKRGENYILTGEAGKAVENFSKSLELFNKNINGNEMLPETLFNRAFLYQQLQLSEQSINDLQRFIELDTNSKWTEEANQELSHIKEKASALNLPNDKIFENFQNAYRNQNSNQAWQMLKLANTRNGNFIIDKLLTNFLEEFSNLENIQTSENLKMLNFAGETAKQSVGEAYLFDLAKFYSQVKPQQLETLKNGRLAVKQGLALYHKAEIDGAIKEFTAAKKFFNAAQDSPEESFANIWIGLSKLRAPQNEMKGEIELFTKLSKTFENKNYHSFRLQSLSALAEIMTNSSKLSDSFEMAQKVSEIARKVEDTEMMLRSYQNIVSFNINVRKYNDSLKALFFVFDVANNFPVKPNVLWTFYSHAAKNFNQLGYKELAYAYQEKVLKLAEETGNPQLKSRSFEQLALFYSLDNNFEKAIEFGEKALYVGAEKIESEKLRKNTTSRISLFLGDVYRKSGDYQKALNFYQKAQDIYQEIDFKFSFYQIYRGKALTYIALKNNDLAQVELQEAIKQYEFFRKNIYEESSRNSFFDIEQGIYDVAVDFAYSQLNDPVQALDYSEKNRARSLFDLLQTDKLLIEQKEIPEISLKSMNSPVEISKLQNQMQPNSQILEFAVLENKIISWVITKDSIKSAQTEVSSTDLREKIKNYLKSLNSNDEIEKPNSEQFARELYQTLITPNESFLDINKTLFIIPDKDLHFLPFSSLIDTDNKYLVEKYTIGISPSLNVFSLNSVTAKTTSSEKPEKLLAIGNPLFDKEKYKDLEYLPSAVREVTEIAQFYKPFQSVLVNKEATKQKILSEISDFDVIHFASHAVTDEKTPMFSSLILAGAGENDDGMLRAFEIYQQKLPKTKLVILSACQTAIEQAFRGEGAISLARPFIARGVPVVVASLWKVESEPTTELMINFHRERKEKKLNSLKALRQAQIMMINSPNTIFRQPKSWASFIAISSELSF